MSRPLLILVALLLLAWAIVRMVGGWGPYAPEFEAGPTDTAATREHSPALDGAAIDLLLRGPDERLEQPGPLLPSTEFGWGEYGGLGWARWKPEWVAPDGGDWIESNQPVASLVLPAARPRERTLELVLWCPDPEAARAPAVSLRLNGRAIGRHALDGEPTTLRVAVPADAWRRGGNLLELEASEREAGASSTSPSWNTLALAMVTYGEEQRVTYDVAARRYAPAAGTGLGYRVEHAGGARFRLGGSADGPGELAVGLGQVSVRDGRPAGAGELETLDVQRQVERTFVLAPNDGATVSSIELLWQPANGVDEFRLEHASVLEDAPRPRPNVVLVSIDTLAARHTSVHGYGRRTTPSLERFAQDAVLFERCIANAPWTLPSYLSTLTGLYPLSHRVPLQNESGAGLDNYDFWQVAESRWTLAEALRARGYQTAASLDTYWLSPRFRVDQGFDVYDLEAAAYPFGDPHKGIRFILERFAPWLDDQRSPAAPFFAFIHALDAHGPYWPEAPYLGTFEDSVPADPRMTPAGGTWQTFGALPTWMAYSVCPPELRLQATEEWAIPAELPLEEVIARYDESILKTDASLGHMFDILKERGLYDDSVIVITGDHGESFAHGVYSHGVLWEDVLHVPLLIKLPGSELGGTRVATSVQLVDLYPTLLELVGAGPARDYLHGRSLLELRSGGITPRPTFSQGGHIDQAMIESGGWKLVEAHPDRGCIASVLTHPLVRESQRAWLAEHVPALAQSGVLRPETELALRNDAAFPRSLEQLKQRIRGPHYELYHIAADPDELVDLAGQHPERVAELKALLEQELRRARSAQTTARPNRSVGPRRQLSPQERERLGELGYVGSEGG